MRRGVDDRSLKECNQHYYNAENVHCAVDEVLGTMPVLKREEH